MGDININVRKDLDAAEANFEMILKKDPDNVQANHNLCVVYVERGQLLAAEKCLEKTLQLAPQEDYVQQHLNIVRTRINQAQQVCKYNIIAWRLRDHCFECVCVCVYVSERERKRERL